MVIGIDGNEANVTNRVGVNEYAFELLWGFYRLQKNWGNKHRLIVFLKEKPNKELPPANNFLKYEVLPGKGLWILSTLTPKLLFNGSKLDIFFSLNHYVPPIARCPLACSIMDLGYLKFADQFTKKDFWQLKLWTAYSLLVSKKVFAISNSTKEEIVRHYKFASKKVTVTHLGYDRDKYNPLVSNNDVRLIRQKYSIVNDYILFISTLKPSKNIEGLLTAWKLVVDKRDEIKLIIAGKKGWLYDSIFRKAKELQLVDSVIFTDYVPEEDKPALIKGAKLLVLPSFWEGFGLDPLYAMACGTPVVVSNVGSLPEVVGNAGLLVDPYKPATIANAILDVLDMNKVEYNKLVAKALEQAKKFSWDITARLTLEELLKR